jgi:NADPH-dependent glutamate synthase beta subunit-like oxidoreductase
MKAHATPCTKECPAGTDIPGYFEKIRKGNWDEAAKTHHEGHPIPAITGRVAHISQRDDSKIKREKLQPYARTAPKKRPVHPG